VHFAIFCRLRSDSQAARVALRLSHLEYIRDHREQILFGGPTLGPEDSPETMVIVIKADGLSGAEQLIAAEPYTASQAVFESIEIRPWVQILPELTAGALAQQIAGERARISACEEPKSAPP